MSAKGGYVYIVSNKNRTVLYTGVTSNLNARIQEHKAGEGSAFTKKYNCTDLVYYKFFETIEAAIDREKKIKKWNRAWKDKLIKDFNPDLRDLYDRVSEMT
ncbi:MAG: GIY-YIG nuclease family protein [Cyclobacteriaceae bacterium]